VSTVVVIDYGLGNLASVAGALRHLGHVPAVSADPDAVARAGRVILPGVGAFGDGMARLAGRGMIDAIKAFVATGRPLLGICLGLQLLARESEEFGPHKGLGLLPGRVTSVAPSDPGLRSQHVGWNDVRQTRPCVLLDGIPDGALFYHVHGFRLVAEDPAIVVAETDHGGRFPSVVNTGNLFATQFHPEKSQRHGLALLGNFVTRT
jgi:glutamine amidotransferase